MSTPQEKKQTKKTIFLAFLPLQQAYTETVPSQVGRTTMKEKSPSAGESEHIY